MYGNSKIRYLISNGKTFSGQECLLRNDVFAELYRGNRSISASGKQCLSACRGSSGIGASCVMDDPVVGRVAQCCHIPHCGMYIVVNIEIKLNEY